MRRRGLSSLVLILLSPAVSVAYSTGPPTDHVRIPWPATALRSCTACHTGAVNSWPGGITLMGLPSAYRDGVTYALRVVLTDPDPTRGRWGFELAVLDGALRPGGSLFATDGNTSVVFDGIRAVDFVRQTAVGSSVQTWDFDWTAPLAGSGEVTMYYCGNAADGGCCPDGDHIFCSVAVLAEELCDPKPQRIAGLVVARVGGDLDWSWWPDPSAAGGYRLYAVAARAEIPRANQDLTPTALRGCAAPGASDTSCREAGVALDGESLFYQMVGVCANGDEGPN